MVYIFTLQKIVAQWGRIHPFFTFIVILVKFSAPKSSNFLCGNMGHKELKKSSKYKLVIFLDEKQRFTFAIFLPLFIQGAPLTHTASERNIWCWGDSFHRVRLSMMHINCWIEHEGIWLTQSHLLYTNRVAWCQIIYTNQFTK